MIELTGKIQHRKDLHRCRGSNFHISEVYTTSVNGATLDECPMAYKDMRDIVDNIGPTADIIKVIKPLYNFKAGEEG